MSIPLLDDVRMPAAKILLTLGFLNRMAIGHTLVSCQPERRIEAVLAHIVHEVTVEGRAREIASNQMIMLAQREQLADAWAAYFHGEAAVREHPLMRARPGPDEMLSILAQHYVPLRAAPSQLAVASQFTAIAVEFENSPVFSMGDDASGIALADWGVNSDDSVNA